MEGSDMSSHRGRIASAVFINPGKSGNEVTLTGRVPTEDDKRVAEEITRSTKGVGNVVNNLQVGPKTQANNAESQYVPDLLSGGKRQA